jgi:hypothetical protein
MCHVVCDDDNLDKGERQARKGYGEVKKNASISIFLPIRLELVKALLLYIFWFPKLPLPKK